jgi:multiple sugar transport system permease protein/arabinosaccharide transport system permease protein
MGLVLPGAIDAFAIFWMRQAMEPIPDDLLDAARIDGCNEFAIYWRITLPVVRPALAALALLTLMGIYNDFVWPVIITNSPNMETLQVLLSGLATRVSGSNLGADFAQVWGELLAASTIAMAPLVIAFLALQRQFVAGILAGSMKG